MKNGIHQRFRVKRKRQSGGSITASRAASNFAQAIKDGSAGKSTLAARVASSLATIRLDFEDAAVVRDLAERQGLDYQELIWQIVHNAIQREVTRSA